MQTLLRKKPNIVDESNHKGAEQESFLEQERFADGNNLYSEKEWRIAIRPAVWAVGHFLWSGRQANENLVI